MRKKRFRCKNKDCRFEFVIEVFEQGEAEAKRVPTAPARCPKCRHTQLEEIG